MKDLETLLNKDMFSSDFQFHCELRDVLSKLHDAHTAYLPPQCYNFQMYQPFPIRQMEDGSFEIYEFKSQHDLDLEVNKKYEKLYPSRTDLYTNKYSGSKIVKIDGKPPLDVIKDYAENKCTYSRDSMIRYNQVLRSEWHKRTTLRQSVPLAGFIKYTINYNNTEIDIEAPWIAVSHLDYRFQSFKVLCGYEEAEERRSFFSFDPMSSMLQSTFSSYLPSASTITQKAIKEQLNIHEINRQLEVQHISRKKSERRESSTKPKKEEDPPGYENIPLTYSSDFKYYKLFYNNNTATGLLRVITFMPTMDILGPQTQESVLEAIAAFQAYFEQLHSAFNKMEKLGVKKIILDVRGNVGGVGCLAFVLLRYISPYAPHDPSPNADLVYTKLGDALHCKFNILDRLSFFNQDRKPVSSGWYSSGPIIKRGARESQYSKKVHFGCGMQFILLGAGYRWENSPVMFEPENVLVLTDGTCGSTCGIFVKLIQYLNLGKIVSQGGVFDAKDEVQKNMNSASFPGGAVKTGGQLLKELEMYSSVCPTADYWFGRPESNAIVTFAWMEVYAWDPKIAAFELDKVNDAIPMGHRLKPADFHIKSWDFGNEIFSKPEFLGFFDVCAEWEVRRNDACAPDELPFLHAIYGNPCENGTFSTKCVLRGCERNYYLGESGDICKPMPEEYDLLGMAVKILIAGFFVAGTILSFYLSYFCCYCTIICAICITCVLAIFRLKKKKNSSGTPRSPGGLNIQDDQEMGEYSRLPGEEDHVDVDDVEIPDDVLDERNSSLLDAQDSGIID